MCELLKGIFVQMKRVNYMKNLALLILSIVLIFHLSGCSNAPKTDTKRRQAIVSDVYDRYDGKEIHFERQSVNSLEIIEDPLHIEYIPEIERPVISKIDSEITTLYDGFGNKTETRLFSDDPLVRLVVIKTLANGDKTAFVYAQNGEIKTLPNTLVERGLDLRGNEIAQAVGIFEGKSPKENEFLLTQELPLSASPLDIILENSVQTANTSSPKEEVLPNQDTIKQEKQPEPIKQELPQNNPVNQPNQMDLLKQINQTNLMKPNKPNIAKQGELLQKKEQ